MRHHHLLLCLSGILILACTQDNKQQAQIPGPQEMMVGEDISVFGVALDETPLPSTEVDNEQIVTSPSASNYYDFVENSNFNQQVKLTYTDGKVAVENAPSSVAVQCDGADVIVNSSAAGVEYIMQGKTDNGSLTIHSQQNVKITLNGCKIKNPDGGVITVTGAPYTYLAIEGNDNYLEDGFVLKEKKKNDDPDDDGSANYSIDELKRQSKSQAKANASGVKKKKNSIKGTILTDHNLVFSGRGKLNIQCNSKSGIRADEEVAFRPGNVITVKTREGKGVSAKTGIVIYGGVLNVDATNSGKRGISSKGMLAIYGGRTSVLTSGSDKCEGIESKGVMLINGGDIQVAATDDALNAGEDLVVNGGNIYACSSVNDGMDANGNLIINGGNIVASGGKAPECGLDANEEAGFHLFINGGTVVATGGNHSVPSNKSRQNTVIYGTALGSTGCMGIASEEGPLMAYNLLRDYGDMGGQWLVSLPQLTKGATYSIFKAEACTTTDNTRFGLTLQPQELETEQVERIDKLETPVTKLGKFFDPPAGGPGMPPPTDGQRPQ